MNTSRRIILLGLSLALASSIAQADFQVSGVFQYEKRQQVFTTQFGVPCWQGLQNKPIRYAKVEVFNAVTNTALVDGWTDANGNFSVLVPSDGQPTISVFVRCYAHVRSGQFGTAVFNVTDQDDVEYAVKSNLYRNWNTQNNLNFGTVVAHGVNLSGLIDHPFNDYDNLVWMLSYFESRSGFHPTVPLSVVWPTIGVSNSTYEGPGGEHPGVGKIKLNWANAGDNDSIILHEMGHYLAYEYCGGFGGSGGGQHTAGESNQDPRLSYGEGLATLIEGLIRKYRGDYDPGYYSLCPPYASGAVSNGGWRFEDGYPYAGALGPGSETAVTFALWDLTDTANTDDGNTGDDDAADGSFLFQGLLTGEDLLWQSLLWVLPTLPNDPPYFFVRYLMFEKLWNAFFVPTDWENQQEVLDTITPWGMMYENDAWEPDNDTNAATPLAQGAWSPIHTLYYAAGSPGAPGIGDSDFFSFSPVVGVPVSVLTAFPTNDCGAPNTDVDPYLVIRPPAGGQYQADGGGSCPGNAGLTFTPSASGVYTIEVKASPLEPSRRTGSYIVKWWQ